MESVSFTFVTNTFHFVHGLLSVLLCQMLGFLHRLAQELLQLGPEMKKMVSREDEDEDVRFDKEL